MLTTTDFIKLKKVFVTKKELKMEILELKAELLTYFVTKDEFQEAIAELKDEFITRFDAVMGELKAMREESAALAHRSSEHSDQLENHDSRLISLEAKTPLKP